MSRALKGSITLYISVLHVGLLTGLLLLWPVPTAAVRVSLALDLRYLLLVGMAGALGSTLHLTSSFVEHAAQNRLHGCWGLWYFIRPLIGFSLAVLGYLLLRGGLITGTNAVGTESLNPYGISAMAALTGLFSRQAMRKLKETFEHLCATRDQEPPATTCE